MKKKISTTILDSPEIKLSKKQELLPNELADKLEVVVADGGGLLEAQNMIAREYSLFMSSKERDLQTAFADLFSDEPDEKISTFVVVDNNSLVSTAGKVLATNRLAFGDTCITNQGFSHSFFKSFQVLGIFCKRSADCLIY